MVTGVAIVTYTEPLRQMLGRFTRSLRMEEKVEVGGRPWGHICGEPNINVRWLILVLSSTICLIWLLSFSSAGVGLSRSDQGGWASSTLDPHEHWHVLVTINCLLLNHKCIDNPYIQYWSWKRYCSKNESSPSSTRYLDQKVPPHLRCPSYGDGHLLHSMQVMPFRITTLTCMIGILIYIDFSHGMIRIQYTAEKHRYRWVSASQNHRLRRWRM